MRASLLSMLVVAPILAWPGAAAAVEPVAASWCVIASSHPYRAFAGAQERVVKLRAAGAAQAGVYDGRDFSNLAGELVVIASRHTGPAARQEAVQQVKQLRRRRLSSYAKPCLAAVDRLLAVGRAQDLRPVPVVLPGVPLKLDPASPLTTGCLAWSARRRSALCVTGSETWQTGRHWTLEFVGDPDWKAVPVVDREAHDGQGDAALRPQGEVARVLRQRLAAAAYTTLPAAVRDLSPGETYHSTTPPFVVRWARTTQHATRSRKPDEFDWDVHTDRITLHCGSGAGTVVAEDSGSSGGATARVHVMPGGRHVLVEFHNSRAEEGEYGPLVKASLVELGSGCP